MWRKAFSLPGLATVLAQSQTTLSLSKTHIWNILFSSFDIKCDMEFNICLTVSAWRRFFYCALWTDFNGWTGRTVIDHLLSLCHYKCPQDLDKDSSFKPNTQFYQSIDFCLSNLLCWHIITSSSHYYKPGRVFDIIYCIDNLMWISGFSKFYAFSLLLYL